MSRALSIRSVPDKAGATRRSDPGTWGVVVLNWNTPDNAIECLASILAANSRPRRVVLVDNASTDESVPRIASWAREQRSGVRVTAEHDPIPGAGDEWLIIVASR